MEQSEGISELTKALIKAQAAFKPLTPDKQNPHFKNRYASLEKCFEVTKDALAANGLAVTQWLEPAQDDHIGCTTQIQHTSGEWQRSWVPLPISQQHNPQAAGSAITYGRRYGYCGALGLALDDDDDAEAARPTDAPAPRAAAPQGDELLEKKRKQYFAKGKDAGYTSNQSKQLICDNFHLASFNDATFDQLVRACMFMDGKIAKPAAGQAHQHDEYGYPQDPDGAEDDNR